MSVSIRMRWVAAVCAVIVAASAFAQQSEPPSTPPEEPKPDTPAPAAEAPPPPPKPKSPLGDPPLHRWGGITIAVDVWGPELSNHDDAVAIFNDPALVSTRVIEMPADAKTREHWKAWYHLPKDMGSIRIEYDSMRHEGVAEVLDPGNFAYGELLAFPLFAGLQDDGLADGFAAESLVKTREFRIEYERVAIDTPKVRGSFHFGYRTMDNARSREATYYALLPAFPPFLPPIFDETFNPTPLFPIPDHTQMTSDFTGSGLGGGFDIEYKLFPRVSLKGSLSAGVLRGHIDTRYQASTTTYFFNDPDQGIFNLTFDDVLFLLSFGQDAAEAIFQDGGTITAGLRNRSRLAYELDVSMAVEFKIWRSLNASAGLRELAYIDVASDVTPGTPVIQPNGNINFQTVNEVDKSVGYEGFFFGLSYRF